MNVAGNEMNEDVNVLPLFSNVVLPERRAELRRESELDLIIDEVPDVIESKRVLVSEQQFPDQSMYVLDQQIEVLKENLARLKFYLSDLSDLLPR